MTGSIRPLKPACRSGSSVQCRPRTRRLPASRAVRPPGARDLQRGPAKERSASGKGGQREVDAFCIPPGIVFPAWRLCWRFSSPRFTSLRPAGGELPPVMAAPLTALKARPAASIARAKRGASSWKAAGKNGASRRYVGERGEAQVGEAVGGDPGGLVDDPGAGLSQLEARIPSPLEAIRSG